MQEETKQEHTATQKQPEKKKVNLDIRPYLAIGLTAILVVMVCIAIFFVVLRFDGLFSGFQEIFQSLQAIIVGLIVAYLLNPIMKWFERFLYKKSRQKSEELTHKQCQKIRAASVAFAMAVFLTIIVVLIWLIIPQLIVCIEDIVLSMNEKVQNLTEWVDRFLKQDSPLAGPLDTFIADASKYLEEWLRKSVLQQSDFIASITTGVYNVVKAIFNVIIGFIVSVYVLMTKEKFIGQLKKIIYAIFRPRYGNVVMEVVRKADEVFGGFFIGKIIDSLIIGCICFASLAILRMPYVALVSVIVGVTNVVFRTVYRSYSKCNPDFSGRSDEGNLLHYLHYHFAAGGRKCHRTENPWQHDGTVTVLGYLCNSAFRRKFRYNRNAVWCTDFCGTVLYHKTSGRTCAEKTAAAGADEGIYRA